MPPVMTVPGSTRPCGYQRIAAFSTLQSLTIPPNGRWAIIIPSTNAVRYRDDGTNPTATVGMPIAVGQPLEYSGDLTTFKVIPQSGSATLDIVYYS
jgi:hypothetical protein